MDEYWSAVIGVYVSVGAGPDDGLRRTATHISAASATNTGIMIPDLNLSLICSAGFCNPYQLCVNEFGPVLECRVYL